MSPIEEKTATDARRPWSAWARRGRGAQGEQQQVAQRRSRRGPSRSRGSRARSAGIHIAAKARPDSAGAPRPMASRSASEEHGEGADRRRGARPSRTPCMGTSDALMTVTPSRAVASVRSNEPRVGQDAHASGGGAVADQDDARRTRRDPASDGAHHDRVTARTPMTTAATTSTMNQVVESQVPRTMRFCSASRLEHVAGRHQRRCRARRADRGGSGAGADHGPIPAAGASSRRSARRA